MIESILKNCLITKTSVAATTADSAITTGTIIDLASPTEGCFDSVCFVALLGDVVDTCVATLKAYCGDIAGLGSGAAYKTVTATVTATAVEAFADNNLLILDVVKPGYRYVRADLTRTPQGCVLDGIIAIRYNARTMPTVTVAGIADGKISVS